MGTFTESTVRLRGALLLLKLAHRAPELRYCAAWLCHSSAYLYAPPLPLLSPSPSPSLVRIECKRAAPPLEIAGIPPIQSIALTRRISASFGGEYPRADMTGQRARVNLASAFAREPCCAKRLGALHTEKAPFGVMHHVGARSEDVVCRDWFADAVHVEAVPDKERRGMRERGVCGVPAAATAGTVADWPLDCVACVLPLMHMIHLHVSVLGNVKHIELTGGILYLAAAWYAVTGDGTVASWQHSPWPHAAVELAVAGASCWSECGGTHLLVLWESRGLVASRGVWLLVYLGSLDCRMQLGKFASSSAVPRMPWLSLVPQHTSPSATTAAAPEGLSFASAAVGSASSTADLATFGTALAGAMAIAPRPRGVSPGARLTLCSASGGTGLRALGAALDACEHGLASLPLSGTFLWLLPARGVGMPLLAGVMGFVDVDDDQPGVSSIGVRLRRGGPLMPKQRLRCSGGAARGEKRSGSLACSASGDISERHWRSSLRRRSRMQPGSCAAAPVGRFPSATGGVPCSAASFWPVSCPAASSGNRSSMSSRSCASSGTASTCCIRETPSGIVAGSGDTSSGAKTFAPQHLLPGVLSGEPCRGVLLGEHGRRSARFDSSPSAMRGVEDADPVGVPAILGEVLT